MCINYKYICLIWYNQAFLDQYTIKEYFYTYHLIMHFNIKLKKHRMFFETVRVCCETELNLDCSLHLTYL